MKIEIEIPDFPKIEKPQFPRASIPILHFALLKLPKEKIYTSSLVTDEQLKEFEETGHTTVFLRQGDCMRCVEIDKEDVEIEVKEKLWDMNKGTLRYY